MLEAVLFDLDGTVINTNNLILASWKHTLQRHLGKCPRDGEIIRYFGEPLMVTMRRYGGDKAEEMCETYLKFNRAMHDTMISGFEGMDDTIRELKAIGIKVGIVTSKKRSLAEKGLEVFGLLKLMDVVVTVEDTKLGKPNPDPLLKAFEILHVSPDKVVYVGDARYDILCGKNAGCRTCAVKYSMVPIKELMDCGPDYFIEKPMDIVGIATGQKAQAV